MGKSEEYQGDRLKAELHAGLHTRRRRNTRRSVAFLLLSLGTHLNLTAAEPSTNYLPLNPPRRDEATPLWGNEHIGFYPRASTTVGHDDNITLRPANPPEDFIYTFSPGFTLIAGESTSAIGPATSIRTASLGVENHKSGVANRGLMTTSKGFTIDYGAALRYFDRNSDQNAVDHAARLNAALPFERLKLEVSQDIQSLSDSTIDFANRIRRQLYYTDLRARYDLNERYSVQLSARQTISDYEVGIGSREWQGMGYLNYAYSPRMNVGVGGGGGLLKPDNAFTQRYAQGRFRISYELTEKVHLDASAGAEVRRFPESIGPSTEAVFDLVGKYALSPNLQIRVEGGRRPQSSALYLGQNYVDTHAGLIFQYLSSGRFSSYMALDYHHLNYGAAQATAVATRRDDYLAVRVGVGIELALRWSLGLYYQYRQNSSVDPLYDYDNNQAGLTLAWAY